MEMKMSHLLSIQNWDGSYMGRPHLRNISLKMSLGLMSGEVTWSRAILVTSRYSLLTWLAEKAIDTKLKQL
ncbi:hypothetical protein LAZ67_7003351 [Cordylochernes scorpioides]|uniref:Uncharacterized protein n=1 Tax=Cordylochernes scorpioides TaxID=51811 RepID=A0ABY6KNV5_9ARAC|nr:hypothetical protein LAZ67_7003351 [Cordylochernes scorpioides]